MRLNALQKQLEEKAASMPCPVWKKHLSEMSALVGKSLETAAVMGTARKLGAGDPLFAAMDRKLSKEHAAIYVKASAAAAAMAVDIPDRGAAALLEQTVVELLGLSRQMAANQ